MPLYEFRCGEGHLSEALLPMSSTTRDRQCPECDNTAKRLVSAPAVRSLNPTLTNAIDSANRSAYEPQVHSSLPSSPGAKSTPVSHDPRHRALPRP